MFSMDELIDIFIHILHAAGLAMLSGTLSWLALKGLFEDQSIAETAFFITCAVFLLAL